MLIYRNGKPITNLVDQYATLFYRRCVKFSRWRYRLRSAKRKLAWWWFDSSLRRIPVVIQGWIIQGSIAVLKLLPFWTDYLAAVITHFHFDCEDYRKDDETYFRQLEYWKSVKLKIKEKRLLGENKND